MNWYYADGNTPVGPISEDEFHNLVKRKKIKAETLVWRSGMTEWQAYQEIKNQIATVRSKPAKLKEKTDDSRCSECGKAFSQKDMFAYGNSWVCAACKPDFVQKIKEGLPPEGAMLYAGFWIRFWARMIDSFIVSVIPLAVGFTAAFMAFSGNSNLLESLVPYLQPIMFVLVIGYETWFIGRFGATPGKMACKIKVVTADGGKVSYLRAFGRYFATFLSGIILCIGYIIAGFDKQKRTLHDHICSTRVIRK
jgi:uncharacterized RDD family membrane protein YckC